MKRDLTLLSAFMIFSFISMGYVDAKDRYVHGRSVYARALYDCAKWWFRLGDITKSNGKWKNSGDLAMELGHKSPDYIRRWLKNPMKMYPHVNCEVGRFYSRDEVEDLILYLRRYANNPPVWPVLEIKKLRPVPIKLVNVHDMLRRRFRTLQKIRMLRSGAGNTRIRTPKGARTPTVDRSVKASPAAAGAGR